MLSFSMCLSRSMLLSLLFLRKTIWALDFWHLALSIHLSANPDLAASRTFYRCTGNKKDYLTTERFKSHTVLVNSHFCHFPAIIIFGVDPNFIFMTLQLPNWLIPNIGRRSFTTLPWLSDTWVLTSEFITAPLWSWGAHSSAPEGNYLLSPFSVYWFPVKSSLCINKHLVHPSLL